MDIFGDDGRGFRNVSFKKLARIGRNPSPKRQKLTAPVAITLGKWQDNELTFPGAGASWVNSFSDFWMLSAICAWCFQSSRWTFFWRSCHPALRPLPPQRAPSANSIKRPFSGGKRNFLLDRAMSRFDRVVVSRIVNLLMHLEDGAYKT